MQGTIPVVLYVIAFLFVAGFGSRDSREILANPPPQLKHRSLTNRISFREITTTTTTTYHTNDTTTIVRQTTQTKPRRVFRVLLHQVKKVLRTFGQTVINLGFLWSLTILVKGKAEAQLMLCKFIGHVGTSWMLCQHMRERVMTVENIVKMVRRAVMGSTVTQEPTTPRRLRRRHGMDFLES